MNSVHYKINSVRINVKLNTDNEVWLEVMNVLIGEVVINLPKAQIKEKVRERYY